MHWIPVIAWIAAAVVAVVVLGFFAYELIWKTKRLQRDVAQLQTLTAQLDSMQHSLAAVSERITAARSR